MTAIAFLLVAAAASMVRSVATSSSSFDGRLVGTFSVNVIGAFLLGLLHETDVSTILILGVGGLGALTTFSTFVHQIDDLDQDDRRRDAGVYVLGTLIGGIGAAWVGIELAV
jgi:CrcB protein